MSDKYQERLQRARNNPYTMPDLSQTLNNKQNSYMLFGDRTMKSFTRLGINSRKYSKNSFKQKKVTSQQKHGHKEFEITNQNDYFFNELKDTERAFKNNIIKDNKIEEQHSNTYTQQFLDIQQECKQLKNKYLKEKEENNRKDKIIQDLRRKVIKILKKNENLKKQNEKQQKIQKENLKNFQDEVLKFELKTQETENDLKNQIIDLEGFKVTTQEFFEDFRPLLNIIQGQLKNFFNNFQQKLTNLQKEKKEKVLENLHRLQNLVELFGGELQVLNNIKEEISQSEDYFNNSKLHLPTFSETNPQDLFQL